MPRRTDIESILIIGAGPIVIGQACEFDYSGTQACKALRNDGFRIILVNSNPATIMTDPDLADATYLEPITSEVVTKILERERPNAMLPTMGGQTGLNIALGLHREGVLEALEVELIGARSEAIEKAEDRQLFRQAMERIGLQCPESRLVTSLGEAREFVGTIGLPAIIRPSFTLGGTGSGIAHREHEFDEIVLRGLAASPVGSVLVEESVLGWKEYELEAVRDGADNCIIICSIENIDPMGVHTGDSITVAPALTLTDKEYQVLRNASIAILREIGVDTGGSNVQFAVHPETGRVIVIEMNPRVSRSSALASKATGFPIAKIAALLAVGYTLDELENEITGVTPASFEPTIDYVVTKMPRFAFEKFPATDPRLTTSMKSVGETMSIGRNFHESFQKALRSLETGLTGLNEIEIPRAPERKAVIKALSQPGPERVRMIAQAIRHGISIEEIHTACRYDRWFLERIEEIVQRESRIREGGLPAETYALAQLKLMGFSDARLAELSGATEREVWRLRKTLGARPIFKRVDTCAAEFPSLTPYLYSTYEGVGTGTAGACEAAPSDREKVIILGGGPNRIGQGIEFDYCCVHAAMALRQAGYETVMVNCNPETVSTDYDTSDRLYFEPLTREDVIEVIHREMARGRVLGVIVQFGGQTPLKLVKHLEEAEIPILGTSPDAIDLAEDRERFQALLKRLGLKQPSSGIAYSVEEAIGETRRLGFPVLVRPSYVLGGSAMAIVHDHASMLHFVEKAVRAAGENPVLIDTYLQDAIEVDVDALCDSEGSVYIAGVMEHIEEAGVHSGDSACSLPPRSLDRETVRRIEEQTVLLARELRVRGLMNVQFAVKGREIFVLEVNPRASRTVPFVAKATAVAVAKIASKVMVGARLADFGLAERAAEMPYVAVKEAVLPFNRFPGVDILLGPEMRSTGETMGIDRDFALAFAKSQLGASVKLPFAGRAFISVRDDDKARIVAVVRELAQLGFQLVGTHGTAAYLSEEGIATEAINKVMEGPPHIVEAMMRGEIDLVINTSEKAKSIRDSFSLRRTALIKEIPYFTTVAGSIAAVEAIAALRSGGLTVTSLQDYGAAGRFRELPSDQALLLRTV